MSTDAVADTASESPAEPALASETAPASARDVVIASTVFAALAVSLMAATAIVFGVLSKTNLAQGKHWTTSSVFADCDPVAKRCGGVPTAVFFHTNFEDNPWFEYDLGAPLTFSSLTIMNRSDAVQDRAVPLVVEISNDRRSYQEIARRTNVFDVWEPHFTPIAARYVRLRVARRSFLHLDGVEVHP
jgi:hypothetical protein